jgi:hypothetical protein
MANKIFNHLLQLGESTDFEGVERSLCNSLVLLQASQMSCYSFAMLRSTTRELGIPGYPVKLSMMPSAVPTASIILSQSPE